MKEVPEVEEEKKKKDPYKEMMDKLLMALSVSENKLEVKFSQALSKVRGEIDALSDDDAELKREIMDVREQQMVDRKHADSIEKGMNQLRRDFSAFQNKMFGVDELKPLCDKHVEDLNSIRAQLLSMKEHFPKIHVLEAASKEGKKAQDDLHAKLVSFNESLCERVRSLKERLKECERVPKEERQRVDAVFHDLRGEWSDRMLGFEGVMDENKGRLAGMQAKQDQMQSGYDNSSAALAERLKGMERAIDEKLKSAVSPFNQQIEDCLDRIDFAEAQGNRMNRLEKYSGQHDQMIKEMYRQLKELKNDGA